MLAAKILSAKKLDELEEALNDFLKGEEGPKIQCVSGVTVVPHHTVGPATYVVVVTYEA